MSSTSYVRRTPQHNVAPQVQQRRLQATIVLRRSSYHLSFVGWLVLFRTYVWPSMPPTRQCEQIDEWCAHACSSEERERARDRRRRRIEPETNMARTKEEEVHQCLCVCLLVCCWFQFSPWQTVVNRRKNSMFILHGLFYSFI